MKHRMRYLGRFEINHKELQADPKYYSSPENNQVPVTPPPSYFNGIMFYMMEDVRNGKAEPLLVMISDIILQNPVPIDYSRHGRCKRVGPEGAKINYQSAVNLLNDAIRLNPTEGNRIKKKGWNFC